MPRGSLPGERRGGRKKGSKNKLTPLRKATLKAVIEGGPTPLEIMLAVMRGDTTISELQFAAAAAAAPYVHARLSAASIKHDDVFANMTYDQLYALAVALNPAIADDPDWRRPAGDAYRLQRTAKNHVDP